VRKPIAGRFCADPHAAHCQPPGWHRHSPEWRHRDFL